MKTIARTWHKQIAKIKATARSCDYYESSTGEFLPCEPEAAFTSWNKHFRARLTEEIPGEQWTVHVHSNLFYRLRAQAPAPAPQPEPQAAPEPEPQHANTPLLPSVPGAREEAGCWCGDDPCPMPAQHASAQQSCDAMNYNLAGIAVRRYQRPAAADTHTRKAAAEITERHRAEGIIDSSGLGRSMGPIMASMVEQTVTAKRAQGWSHDEIRAHFTAERATAAAAGKTKTAAVLDTFLAAHAGMIADLAQNAAPAPQAPVSTAESERPALPAAPAAPVRAGVEKLPPQEEGYTPTPGARSYEERQVRAALEAAVVEMKGTEEFWLTIGHRTGGRITVSVTDLAARQPVPPRGPSPKSDRWQARRARVLLALVEAGMRDVVLTNGGVMVTVPRPKGAATVVAVSKSAEYGEKFIDRDIRLPQYPQLTGWVLRRQWGHNYMGPMTPWMENTRTKDQVGTGSKDAQQAAEALAAHYGLMQPVEIRR